MESRRQGGPLEDRWRREEDLSTRQPNTPLLRMASLVRRDDRVRYDERMFAGARIAWTGGLEQRDNSDPGGPEDLAAVRTHLGRRTRTRQLELMDGAKEAKGSVQPARHARRTEKRSETSQPRSPFHPFPLSTTLVQAGTPRLPRMLGGDGREDARVL